MKVAKLFVLLKKLSSEEFKALKKAIHSPIFNSNIRVEMLYEALRPHHPIYDATPVFKEQLFVKVFPNEPFSDQKLRRVFSQLRELIEQTLLHWRINKDEYKKQKLLADIYKERNLIEVHKTKLNQVLSIINKQPVLDSEQLRDKAMVMRDLCYLSKTDFQTSIVYLKKLLDNLDQYYITERWLVNLDLKTMEKTLGKQDIACPIFVELLGSMQLQEAPLNLQLYAQLTSLIEEVNDPKYKKVEQDYWTFYDQLTPKDQKLIFHHLTNFCTNEINLGKLSYRQKLMDLYQVALEKGLLINENNKIDTVQYRNIATLSVLIGNFVWAEKFINDYEKHLIKQERVVIKNISLGFLHFYKKDFHKVTDILQTQTFVNINNTLSAKSLLLRSYFELLISDQRYFTLFDSFSDSFAIYIKRKKLSKEKGERYNSLVRILQKVGTRINSRKEYKHLIKKWKMEVNTAKAIASRRWVLEKLEELKT